MPLAADTPCVDGTFWKNWYYHVICNLQPLPENGDSCPVMAFIYPTPDYPGAATGPPESFPAANRLGVPESVGVRQRGDLLGAGQARQVGSVAHHGTGRVCLQQLVGPGDFRITG